MKTLKLQKNRNRVIKTKYLRQKNRYRILKNKLFNMKEIDFKMIGEIRIKIARDSNNYN